MAYFLSGNKKPLCRREKGETMIPYRQKWKGTMTDRERFNNQMHYRPVDRCFNMEFGYWKENYEV